jgi:tetratricopeptide (TPR) repeat protein
MATIAELFAAALQHYQSGQRQLAIDCLQAILRLNPGIPEAHSNLGMLLAEEGRREEAVSSFQQAVRLKPDFVDALNNLGNALREQGCVEEAVEHLRRALGLQPGHVEAHYNLGIALEAQGKKDEAVSSFLEAIRLKPDHVHAHVSLGGALFWQGRRVEGLALLKQALHLNPASAEAHHALGTALHGEDKLGEAEAHYRQALRIQPHFAEAHNNLASALRGQGRLKEAEAAVGQALRYRPDFAEAHNTFATICLAEKYLDKALAHLEEALRLKPDFGDARYNRSLIWLVQGDWTRGLPEYEFRWQRAERPPSPSAGPLWDGSPLDGRTILLHCEQGLGDTLQFVRYVPLVKARGGRTVLLCQAPIRRLLENVAGIDQLLSPGDPLPSYDLQAPLMSLPLVFGTTVDTVPVRVPYLLVPQELIDKWHAELSKISGFRVGISWQGSPNYKADWQRSFPLARFEPLAQVPGVRLISLQKGPGREQMGKVSFPIVDFGDRLDGENSPPFMDTAAVMHSLDLVICPDSALAHLAGAMGIRTWVALSLMSDWRWLLDREDCPWYPAHRLFRQHVQGNWNAVFDRMTAALANVAPSSIR